MKQNFYIRSKISIILVVLSVSLAACSNEKSESFNHNFLENVNSTKPIMIAGDIPNQTRTIPLAIYSLANTIGGIKSGWPLVLMAISLSSISLICGEILERRGWRNDNS